MLSRLVHLESWHGTLTGFKVENGLDGNVSERGDGYEMVIRGLSVDQLIKVAGFIKQLWGKNEWSPERQEKQR